MSPNADVGVHGKSVGPAAVLLAISLVICVILFWAHRDFYHDDAFISLRYARHLADGAGLVWNVGERVEGYTNFLWVIGLGVLGRLGIDLMVASRALGIASFALLLFLLGVRRSELCPKCGLFALLPASMTASCAFIVAWALGGLETVLFSLMIVLGVLECSRILSGRGGVVSRSSVRVRGYGST